MATPADVPSILRILRESFRPDLLPALPLGSPGAARFVEATLSPWTDCDWYVAEDGEVRGFCEIRRLPDAICLNHIFVDERHRGAGLGANLLKSILPRYADSGFFNIILDVFAHAPSAMQWYSKLGFAARTKTIWAEVSLSGIECARSLPARMNVHSLGMAEATHKTYGISEFHITEGHCDYRIGRIGAEVYRCGDPSILEKRAVLAVMRGIDPVRSKLILIAPAGSWKDSSNVRTLAEAARMQASLETVLANLR